MQEFKPTITSNSIKGDIDLLEVMKIIFGGKWIIFVCTIFMSISVVIFSLNLPNIYQSKAILASTEASQSISSSLKAYSGIASLAGVNLPQQGVDTNAAQAIQKFSSFSFFKNSIYTNIHLPELMALDFWDAESNSLVFDKNIYDKSTNTWVRKFAYPQQPVPSAQESFLEFKTNHLSLTEDSKNGFVTLKIRHQSPMIAKEWADLMVTEINNFYRKRDKVEAEKAIEFLNEQMAITNFTQTKQVVAQILQQEIQKLTLINANESYVFEYIDPPVVMEKKFAPNRAMICILGFIFGILLGISIVLFRHYVFKK